MPNSTLQKLQQPTFSLISSFYGMPEDIQSVFVTMLALYEQEPTPERANFLFDKIMGKESVDAKKDWFNQQASTIPLFLRKQVENKYIRDKNAVPKGVPTSGNLLVGLGVVSRSDKELLMDAQAAARIWDHLKNPNHVKLSQELFAKDANGQMIEARSYLDKPFSTPIQRLEHLSAILAGYQVVQEPYQTTASKVPDNFGMFVPDIKPALVEIQKAAISTLYQVAEKLSPASREVAGQIQRVAEALAPRESVKDWSMGPVSDTMKRVLPCLFNWHAPHLDKSKVNPCEDSYTGEERDLVEKLVTKRINQVQTAGSMTLSKERTA